MSNKFTINRKIPEGRLRLWLSVDRNHAIVQYELLSKLNDQIKSSKNQSKTPSLAIVKHYRFTVQNMIQIGDVWLPTEVNSDLSTQLLDKQQLKSHQNWTFEKILLGSSDDEELVITQPQLPVGTQVSFDGDVNPNGSIRFYRWDSESYIPEKSIFKSE